MFTQKIFFCIAALLAMTSAIVLPQPTYAQGTKLSYQLKTGMEMVYQVNIAVEDGDEMVKFDGLIRYAVTAANADSISLTYRGGLTEMKQTKAGAGGRQAGFGPRGFGGPRGPGFPGGPLGPFAKSTFAGKTQTTNKITLKPNGEVAAIEGDSQLPYLLGNVSLLPFEMLPNGNERAWRHNANLSVVQKNSRGFPFGPGGPGSPFGQPDEKQQAATEFTDYAIQAEDTERIVLKKSYQFNKPKVVDDPSMNIVGEGTWTFNLQDHLPDAIDFKQKLTIVDGNTQTAFPISIKYQRLSADAIAKLDLEAKQKRDEINKKMAEDLQQAEAPLTAVEKRDAMESLASTNTSKLTETLSFLRRKTPKEPDSEIAAKIEKLLKHSDSKIQEAARAALANWSPEFGVRQKLNAAYSSHMPVESTERFVESTTPLYVGQILQFQQSQGPWYAGEVVELLSDGKFKVLKRGPFRQEHILTRRNLQLAPDGLDQPNKSAKVATVGTRTWTSVSDGSKIEAVYLGFADGKVKMKRADGKEFTAPLERFSKADQDYVKQQLGSNDDPFVP